MSDNAKASDNAAQALARHFDQERNGQMNFQHAQAGPSTFRANSAGGHQGNQQFVDNQMAAMSLSDQNNQTGLLSANVPENFFRPVESPPQSYLAAVAKFNAAADEAALVEARQNSAFTQQPTFPAADQGAMTAGVVPYGHQHEMNAQRFNNMQYDGPRIHAAYRPPGYQPWDHPVVPISKEAAAWELGFEEAMDQWMEQQCDVEKAEYAEAVKVADKFDAFHDAAVAEARAISARADADEAAAAAGLPRGGPTELSQTAQMLVNAVERDDSEKFQKSNFLQLMRRIAAQEVVLEGNSLVEATEDQSTPRPRDKGKGKANYIGEKRD